MVIKRLGENRSLVQKTGTDKLFGNGADGTIVIASDTSLARDMYYNNLTVNSGVVLFTNGFRVFVKNALVNNGTVGMPQATAMTTAVRGGTVSTRSDSSLTILASENIDGNLPIGQVKDFDSILLGTRQNAQSLSRFIPASLGSAGTANAGAAGGGGNATAGNAGVAGAAGQGGGTVLVMALSISGSGTFVSQGSAGTSGTSGNAGTSVASTSYHNPATTGHAHTHGGNSAVHNPANAYVNGSYTDTPHCAHTHGHQSCGAHCGVACGSMHPAYHHNNVGHNAASHHHNPQHTHSHSHNIAGNQSHNPSYSGGAGGTANAGNPGGVGSIYVMTRGISTHVASHDKTLVRDLDS